MQEKTPRRTFFRWTLHCGGGWALRCWGGKKSVHVSGMDRQWTDNASTLDRQSPEKDRPTGSKSKVERPSAEADSKTIYLLVQNYPKLKKIIHSQITQI